MLHCHSHEVIASWRLGKAASSTILDASKTCCRRASSLYLEARTAWYAKGRYLPPDAAGIVGLVVLLLDDYVILRQVVFLVKRGGGSSTGWASHRW
jgi:hypothetical protein